MSEENGMSGLLAGLLETLQEKKRSHDAIKTKLVEAGYSDEDLCKIQNALTLLNDSKTTLMTLAHLCSNHGMVSSGKAAQVLTAEMLGAAEYVRGIEEDHDVDLEFSADSHKALKKMANSLDNMVESVEKERDEASKNAKDVPGTATLQA